MEATSTGIVRQSNSADTGTRIVNRKNKKTLFNFTFFVYKIDFIYDVSDFILFSSNNCTDKKLNTKTFRNLEICSDNVK